MRVVLSASLNLFNAFYYSVHVMLNCRPTHKEVGAYLVAIAIPDAAPRLPDGLSSFNVVQMRTDEVKQKDRSKTGRLRAWLDDKDWFEGVAVVAGHVTHVNG